MNPGGLITYLGFTAFVGFFVYAILGGMLTSMHENLGELDLNPENRLAPCTRQLTIAEDDLHWLLSQRSKETSALALNSNNTIEKFGETSNRIDQLEKHCYGKITALFDQAIESLKSLRHTGSLSIDTLNQSKVNARSATSKITASNQTKESPPLK